MAYQILLHGISNFGMDAWPSIGHFYDNNKCGGGAGGDITSLKELERGGGLYTLKIVSLR